MNGFLDTDGKLHQCEAWEHLDKAFEIVRDMNVEVLNRLEAEDYLQNLGWIVVRSRDVFGLIGHFKGSSRDIRHHLTDAQKEWLITNYKNMTAECRESVDELFRWDK